MKSQNFKGALALLVILYLIASSNNGYDNSRSDLNATTQAIDRGRIHLFNAIDDSPKRERQRWKEYRKRNRRNK